MQQHGRYNPQDTERKWQIRWIEGHAFRTPALSPKPKFYVLDMFPYPSGHGLHVGHLKGYIASDVIARYKRMRGFNVLHPMGWDSFGLPTERQAEKDGIAPQAVTRRNIETFKRQMNLVGLCYDWDREFATSDVDYYRWTQWIFNLLFERGLAYQAEVAVNWCPALGTVVANEEVQDGVYIDTGDPVERRNMRQWLLRITQYADRLAKDLDLVDWSDQIKDLQRNWIGRSIGALVIFKIEHAELQFEVFSSRPETLFGCTFCALAPEHPLVTQVTTEGHQVEVARYLARCMALSERDRQTGALEKTGAFTGSFARHPLTGEAIPIWVADYVLPSYGTGAIFGCPAHDQRDFDFAKAHGLQVKAVVAAPGLETSLPYLGEGVLTNSQFLDGMETTTGKEKVIAHLSVIGAGGPKVHYNLRDWLFSRQRYWGEPIPIVFVDGQPESDPRLPVVLPERTLLTPNRPGAREAAPPLAQAGTWVATTSPTTGVPALRETNVMPQWAGSCWYYLRFIDPHNAGAAFDPKAEKAWMPVDLYMGGAEHATLHLLYARFWHKVLYDAGYVSGEEPFKRLFNQGKVQARSFRDAKGKFYYPHEVVEREGQWFTLDGNGPLLTRFEKMSKSRYNVVSPDDVVAEFGADSLRLYELFMGPVDQDNVWQNEGLGGTRRFLERVWRLVGDHLTNPAEADDGSTITALHGLIKKVTLDLEEVHLNTAISHMMSFLNEAVLRPISRGTADTFVRVLAPFAPHMAEELWERLGNRGYVLDAAWPEYDEAKLQRDTATIVVQVNGRRRGQVLIARGSSEERVLLEAMRQNAVVSAAKGNSPSRVIYRPDQIINLVFPES